MNPLAAAAKAITSAPQQKSVRTNAFLIPGQDGRAHHSDWSTEIAIKEGYTVAPPLFACIDRIMKAVVSVRWYTAKRNTDDPKDFEEISNHPLTQLIYEPNPYMSRELMFQYLVQHKYLGGNALWSKIRVSVGGRRVPVELWPLPPDKVHPVPGRRNFIDGYKIDKSVYRDGRDFIANEDIIHWQFANPNDPYWGIAPLMALARTVDTDVESVRWNMHSMSNRARSSGVLSFEQGLTEEQWQDAREKMRLQHQGSDNAQGVMIMPHGVTFTPWSMTPAEMDFIESRRFNREDICAVHGLMPPAVGYMDDATLANAEIADRAVWHNAAIPFLKLVRAEFNRKLTPEFGPDLWLDFDTSDIEVLQENFDAKVETAFNLFRMGVPFNTINHRLDLQIGDIPGGDHSYLPINLIPADQPHPNVGQRRPNQDSNADPNDTAATGGRSLVDGIVKGASPGDVSTTVADHSTAWTRPTLSDFTSKSWGDLSLSEKRGIARHYAYSKNMPPESFGDLMLPHHRPSDGAIVPRGVFAAAARLNQADIPPADLDRVKAHLRRHYRHMGLSDDIPDVLKDFVHISSNGDYYNLE